MADKELMLAKFMPIPFVYTEPFFRKVVHYCPDAIIGVNRAGIVTIFNEAAEQLTGWRADEVVGKLHVTSLYHHTDVARQIKKDIYNPDMDGYGRLKNAETRLKTRQGLLVPIALSAFLLDEDGVEVGSVGFFHDLTRTKQLEKISITDPLTALHNRYHFYDIAALEMGRSQRYDRPLTLVYLDLDSFKPFNDNFGHQEGDNALRLVGECCRQIIRHQDYAFRLGGDEFSLLLVETGLGDGMLMADRFRTTFNEEWGYRLSATGKKLRSITLSMGVAEFNQSDGACTPAETLDNLIRRADMAMYRAKRAGGDQVCPAAPCK